jgi:hypothetical protein
MHPGELCGISAGISGRSLENLLESFKALSDPANRPSRWTNSSLGWTCGLHGDSNSSPLFISDNQHYVN